jgi:hypothetical protein
MAVTQLGKGIERAHLELPGNRKIVGRCTAGTSNHFGEVFDEQKDCRL